MLQISMSDARRQFNLLDADKSGFLDGAEMTQLAKWAFTQITPDSEPYSPETIKRESKRSSTSTTVIGHNSHVAMCQAAGRHRLE